MNQDSPSQSLTRIISEEDFVPIAREASVDFLSLLGVLGKTGEGVNKLFFFTLLKEAEKLENTLDDHGARSNLRFLYFAEMVACVRNFSLAGFQIYHILERYNAYLSASRDNVRLEFERDAQQTLNYFSKALAGFRDSLLAEAATLGMDVVFKEIPPDAWKVRLAPKLPYTIGGVETVNPRERIISLAQSYRRVFKQFRQQGLHRRLKAKDLPEIIPSRINETMMAGFESQLHNIQSDYDTHIKGSRIEGENPWCFTLRGLTAIPMHLFDSIAWLIHFYERHENQTKGAVGARIAQLVDNGEILKAITGFGLVHSGRYLAEGNEVAERILSMYVTPITYELPLPKPQGFHARPATYVSLVVQEHGTDAFLLLDGKKFSCRSVLELLEAGGNLADKGAKTALFEGDKRCLDDLKTLAANNYCEDRDIPQELNFLRILRNM
jgi:phosphotransferase system HPr-like phosphotransfer protein